MSRRQYILVAPSEFPGRSPYDSCVAVKPLLGVLDEGDSAFLMGANVAFLATGQKIEGLTTRLRERLFGEQMFFLADITTTSRAAKMPQQFWSYLDEAASDRLDKTPSEQAA